MKKKKKKKNRHLDTNPCGTTVFTNFQLEDIQDNFLASAIEK